VFENLDSLEKLEPFASHFGADFYRLPRNKDTITLRKQSWEIPAKIPLGTNNLTPLRASESVAWQVVNSGADA
jgi:dihydroorotase